METPSQEIFDDMKSVASTVWKTYDNTYGYVTKKLDYINRLENVQDNAMVFYRMFDWINQARMEEGLSEDSLEYIKDNK